MRTGTGLILLYDWIQRLLYFNELYSKSSPFNSTFIKNSGYLESGKWSLFFTSPSDAFSLLLFAIGISSSLFIVFGKFIKIGLLANWILQVSIQNKNPFVLHSGDKLLLLIIGILFFSDLNFNRQATEKKTNASFFSGLSLLFLFVSLNLVSGINKISKEWLQDASAVFFAFSNENYSRLSNSSFLELAPLMKLASVCVVLIEIVCPLLLLTAIKNEKLKVIALIPLFILQFLLIVCFEISWFNLLLMVVMVSIYFMPVNVLFQNFKLTELLKFEKGKVLVNTKKYFAAFLFLSLLINSIFAVNFFPYKKSSVWTWVSSIFHLDVNWNLFSPSVYKESVFLLEEGSNLKKQGMKSITYNLSNHRMVKLRENIFLLKDTELNHKIKLSLGPEKKFLLSIKKPKKAFSNKYLVYTLELN